MVWRISAAVCVITLVLYALSSPGPEASLTVTQQIYAADFTYAPQSGRSPLWVRFTDTSTGDISAWNWNFGNGETFYGPHPPRQVYVVDECQTTVVRDIYGEITEVIYDRYKSFTATLTVTERTTGGTDQHSEEVLVEVGCLNAMPYRFTDIAGIDSCPGSTLPFEEEDEIGNVFQLACVGDYYCLRYIPYDGWDYMVGSCPWWGGINDIVLYGIPGESGRPKQWIRAIHRSWDDSCDDFCIAGEPCVGEAGDGFSDMVWQDYSVCLNQLQVTHRWSEPGSEVIWNDHPPDPCAPGTFISPNNPACTPVLALAPAQSSPYMTIISTEIVLAGDPEGGTVELWVGPDSVSVDTDPVDSIEDLAQLLMDAVNNTAEFAPGVEASIDRAVLTLYNTAPEHVSISSTDAGVIQPSPPVDFDYVEVDSTYVLYWTNTGSYDHLHMTKQHMPVGSYLPGASSTHVDSLPWEWTQNYRLIAWKDGMPSEAVLRYMVVGIREEVPRPAAFEIAVWPNPFNAVVNIDFALQRAGFASLRIYDVRGRLVRVLVNEHRPRGEHYAMWNGLNSGGRPVASGVYFVRLEAGGQAQTKKFVLLR